MSKNNLYLFANWKMYLDYNESNILANALAQSVNNLPESVKMVIFPSAISLYPVAQVLRDVGIGVGAQNVYWIDRGGYTGEISAHIYKEAGCDYALVGHSERRHIFNESNKEVRQKLEAVLSQRMMPILCVGETAEERSNGKTEEVVELQLRSALDGLALNNGQKQIFVAYEPVWAIGTGEACDAGEAERMHGLIEKIIKTLLPKAEFNILYGGSVGPDNAAIYLKKPHIDGVLVGSASVKLNSWLDILKAAADY